MLEDLRKKAVEIGADCVEIECKDGATTRQCLLRAGGCGHRLA